MFAKILIANDGSDHAFHAFSLALTIAKEGGAELHMVCIEEVSYLPEIVGEVREDQNLHARRFHAVVSRSRSMAAERSINLHVHVLPGHPVRDIVDLSARMKVDLLVVGARGHSALYERMIGSRADRIAHLAPCPVLVVK